MVRILTVLLSLLAASSMQTDSQPTPQANAAAGELAARPASAVPEGGAPTGLQRLDDRGERGALLYVPTGYRPERSAPLVLMLHGAGGVASHSIGLVERYAEERGAIVLAPTSRAGSWDIISSRRYGPDVKAIDTALAQVFARYAIDPQRIAIGGFSDGASYALSLGIANGALFQNVIAFSPGFMAPTRQGGRPHIFISHGVDDRVLPIEVCSRRLAPQLRDAGYELRYIEFPDGHTVPKAIADQAFDWFLGEP